ncbi:DUF6167 family protein [Aeromicrobium sp. CTD01-1L150]|uniref:DUF6167 family protein n=1 Tax=Aeromicrobium sp. CTD01-1L150 TaxID=3341830 RepID=UPI0035C03268
MNGRIVWFVAGSVAGVYASVKARRAAYRMSMPGLIDQAAALGEGARAFSSEVRDGMRTKQAELERELAGEPDPPDHPNLRPPPTAAQDALVSRPPSNQKDH